MSNLRLGAADDYPCAAGKHLADGQALVAQGRPDGAAYHAGYVIECVVKTLLLLEECSGVPPTPPGPLPHGKHGFFHHDIAELSRDALTLASLSACRRAPLFQAIDSAHPIMARWSEQLRYQAEGAVSDTEASSWVDEASRIYTSVINELRLRGEVIL